MKKLIPIFLIFFTLVVFQTFIHQIEKKKTLSQKIKKCNDLNYDSHILNKSQNFSDIEIDLVIDDERKWKKIILNSHISESKDKSFSFDPKYTDAKITIKNKFGFNCSLKAKIKPHGNLMDHFRDYGPGYDLIYILPSLKVKLSEGNIFGIVEFRLFIPKTRNKGNEIFATTLLQELGFYAPRTSYVDVNYQNKKYKFLFQEKLNKEFLENNSLQEGLIFTADERFMLKYERIKIIDGKMVEPKELGVSKFRLTETKLLKKNKNFIDTAIKTLQTFNVVSHFYSSDLKQMYGVDFFSSQKNKIYQDFFVKMPEFDALMYAIGAEHGLSADDRRFYLDLTNRYFIPLYNDGEISIFSKDKFSPSNVLFDIELKLKNSKKFFYSAKIGAPKIKKKLDKINLDNLSDKLNMRGLNVPINDLRSIIKLIKKNSTLLSNLSDNQIIKVSSKNQHPLKNLNAVKKNIKAKYLFITEKGYKKCDLLLNQCVDIKLDSKKLLSALKQNLKDEDGNKFILLGKLDEFKELKKKTLDNEKVYSFDNLKFKIFGDVAIEINKEIKHIKFIKKKSNSRILFYDSLLKDWKIEFIDIPQDDNIIVLRDSNGLSGCINIYDSTIINLRVFAENARCEDALNLVRTEGSIVEVEIKNSSFDGIDADFSDLTLDNIKIINSQNDCMDFSYGNYILNNLNLEKCSDKAVSTGESSNLEINNFIIKDSMIGIASKDSAVVNSKNGLIDKVDKCFSLYKKKQEFNGGLLKYHNLDCQNYNVFAFKDNHSKLIEVN